MEKGLSAKKKVIRIVLFAIAVLTICFFIFLVEYNKARKEQSEKTNAKSTIVALNEIEELQKAGDARAIDKIEDLKQMLYKYEEPSDEKSTGWIVAIYIVSVLLIVLLFVIVYVLILRPFDELTEFAEEIANGNLEREFHYKRVNMFGQFTWAFDHMRSEIVRARRCEAEAIENNKTVVASLSHDIKTPIASIRGYAEALTMNMDSSPERRERFAEVIIRKCDDVTKITNDLFLHSLHDLDKLSIKHDELMLSKVIYDTLESLSGNADDIMIEGELPQAKTIGDAGRIAQVIENIITNGRKYATGTKLHVSGEISDAHTYTLSIKDEGCGIPDRDMPFIFDKFYRGSNVRSAQGAGLGLYIVKFIMEQLGGKVTVVNQSDGLLVKLIFEIIS